MHCHCKNWTFLFSLEKMVTRDQLNKYRFDLFFLYSVRSNTQKHYTCTFNSSAKSQKNLKFWNAIWTCNNYSQNHLYSIIGSRPFCAMYKILNELNIQFCEENSLVLPKPYLTEVYIEHVHQLNTKGSLCILQTKKECRSCEETKI